MQHGKKSLARGLTVGAADGHCLAVIHRKLFSLYGRDPLEIDPKALVTGEKAAAILAGEKASGMLSDEIDPVVCHNRGLSAAELDIKYL